MLGSYRTFALSSSSRNSHDIVIQSLRALASCGRLCVTGWKVVALQQLAVCCKLNQNYFFHPFHTKFTVQCKSSFQFRTLLYATIEATDAAAKATSSIRTRSMTPYSCRTDKTMLKQIGCIVESKHSNILYASNQVMQRNLYQAKYTQ